LASRQATNGMNNPDRDTKNEGLSCRLSPNLLRAWIKYELVTLGSRTSPWLAPDGSSSPAAAMPIQRNRSDHLGVLHLVRRRAIADKERVREAWGREHNHAFQMFVGAGFKPALSRHCIIAYVDRWSRKNLQKVEIAEGGGFETCPYYRRDRRESRLPRDSNPFPGSLPTSRIFIR